MDAAAAAFKVVERSSASHPTDTGPTYDVRKYIRRRRRYFTFTRVEAKEVHTHSFFITYPHLPPPTGIAGLEIFGWKPVISVGSNPESFLPRILVLLETLFKPKIRKTICRNMMKMF